MNEKLEIWKERFIEADQEYSARLASFDAWTKQYKGNKEIVTDCRRGKNAAIYRKKTERSEQFLRLAIRGLRGRVNNRVAY